MKICKECKRELSLDKFTPDNDGAEHRKQLRGSNEFVMTVK